MGSSPTPPAIMKNLPAKFKKIEEFISNKRKIILILIIVGLVSFLFYGASKYSVFGCVRERETYLLNGENQNCCGGLTAVSVSIEGKSAKMCVTNPPEGMHY